MEDEHYKIVILDDESVVLKVLNSILEKSDIDCDVFCFCEVDQSFWELIDDIVVDVFIVDIRLGSVNGRDISYEIIKKKGGFLFLFISGFDYTEKSLERFNGKCVYDFIKKPIVQESFLNRIEVLLSISKPFRSMVEEQMCEPGPEKVESLRHLYKRMLEKDRRMINSLKKELEVSIKQITNHIKTLR